MLSFKDLQANLSARCSFKWTYRQSFQPVDRCHIADFRSPKRKFPEEALREVYLAWLFWVPARSNRGVRRS